MADLIATLLALRGYRLWRYLSDDYTRYRIAKSKPRLGMHAWGCSVDETGHVDWYLIHYSSPVYKSTYTELAWDQFVGPARDNFNLADFEAQAAPYL